MLADLLAIPANNFSFITGRALFFVAGVEGNSTRNTSRGLSKVCHPGVLAYECSSRTNHYCSFVLILEITVALALNFWRPMALASIIYPVFYQFRCCALHHSSEQRHYQRMLMVKVAIKLTTTIIDVSRTQLSLWSLGKFQSLARKLVRTKYLAFI